MLDPPRPRPATVAGRPVLRGSRADVDGLAVYRRGPAGAPRVVLVHGAMDRAGGFVKLLRRLADLDVTRYDRRGYGASRGPRGDRARHPSGVTGAGAPAEPLRLNRTIDEHVEDLLAVVDDEPATVVGHSLGGVVALAAAARRPDLIPSVAAFEAPMPTRSWSAASARRLAELVEGGDDAAARAAEKFLRRMLGDETWDRLPASMRAERRAEGGAYVADMVAMRQHGAGLDPCALAVPVLAGHGDRSDARHQDAAQLLAERAPGGERWVIAGAAHPAHYTHPGEFARFIERAIERAG